MKIYTLTKEKRIKAKIVSIEDMYYLRSSKAAEALNVGVQRLLKETYHISDKYLGYEGFDDITLEDSEGTVKLYIGSVDVDEDLAEAEIEFNVGLIGTWNLAHINNTKDKL